jgi:hypothetical protein
MRLPILSGSSLILGFFYSFNAELTSGQKWRGFCGLFAKDATLMAVCV